MARVQSQAKGLVPRHARKTTTFDGTAGNGAVGTVAVFTTTGRVYILDGTLFCTSTLTGATATISLGDSTDVDALFGADTATNLVTNDWGAGGGNSNQSSDNYAVVNTGGQQQAKFCAKAVSSNIIYTIATQAVTGGTLVVDLWYIPVTDDGGLS